jgi:hypothetical protein
LIGVQGGFGFKVSTKLWLNWPKAGTAHLPIAVDIELEEMAGPVSHPLQYVISTPIHPQFKLCITSPR